MENQKTEVHVVYTDPQLAAEEYIAAIYETPLSATQKKEIVRAFAAGMLQASTIVMASMAGPDPKKGYEVLDTMLEQVSSFGLKTILEQKAEKAAFKKSVTQN